MGGGPFNVKKGQFTDDSELALGIWYSILKHETYNAEDVADIFLTWCSSDPFDIGKVTILAFGTSNTIHEIKNNAKKFDVSSLSNGCLMKISALGCINVLLNKSFDLQFLATEICNLTNPNPICVDMCICYVCAIDVAVRTGDPIMAFNTAYDLAKEDITKKILECVKYKPVPSVTYFNKSYMSVEADGHQQGYVGIAFQNAFYHLLNTKPTDGFSKVIKDTISIGGDTDTNACIAGALYAGCHGCQNIQTS